MLDLFMAELSGLDFQMRQTGYALPNPPSNEYSGEGLAVVSILGAMQMGPSRLEFGQSTDTGKLINTFYDLASDATINRVLLRVNSGGGSVDGIDEAAGALKSLAAKKPVFASVSGLCASAAYWVASQATKVYATRGSRVGSIGTYTSVVDQTELASRMGVKVHVVKSGIYKGTGVPGAPVEDYQLAEIQRLVDSMTSLFVADVSAARKRDLSKLATGAVFLGDEATKLGLIDGTGGYEAVTAALLRQEAFMTADQSATSRLSYKSFDEIKAENERLRTLYGEKFNERFPKFKNLFQVEEAKQPRRRTSY